MRNLNKEQIEYAVTSLKRIVDSRGLSQTQLEQLSRVNQSTISKIFSRAMVPSFEMLGKLYQAVLIWLSWVWAVICSYENFALGSFCHFFSPFKPVGLI